MIQTNQSQTILHSAVKSISTSIVLGLFLVSGTTCQKKVSSPEYNSPYDETSETYIPTPDLNTTVVTDIKALTATSGGQFQNDYGKPVTAKGVCWSLAQTPTIEASCSSDGSATTNFASNLTGLRPDTVYYVRAYATNEAGTIYGGQRSFRTRDGIATFSGLAVSNVTSSGAAVAVTVDQDGGDAITARGVCYSKEPDPTTAGTCIASGTGTGAVAVAITGLDRATAYYVRPYATNAVMTSYGAQVSFVTLAVLPTVTTGIVSEVVATSATVAGEVTSDGGSPQTTRGICYATTPNPTTANTCVAAGTGAGAFKAELTRLSAGVTYFVRAYATNSVGTAYGSQASFTTAPGPPTVVTGAVSSVTGTSATVAGEVTTTGGATVTARGVVWSTGQNPSLESNNGVTDDRSGTGTFTSSLKDLSRSTSYFVRAYATNSAGTAYGTQVSFTTTASADVSDIDGTVYPTVQIGTQVWMASNLRTSRYRNGDNIPNVTNNATWSGLTTGAWAHYDNNSANETVYGKLYNWHAVADSRNICPTGWHVPSDAEWTVLSNFLATNVGFKMKATSGWGTGNGSNASGFNGLPGGARRYQNGTFDVLGTQGIFWSSSTSRDRYLSRDGNDLYGGNPSNNYGFSVRCVQGEATATPPTVTTGAITNITSSSATVAGEVTTTGGATVTARGVVWSTGQNPSLESNNGVTNDGSGTGTFAATLTGLRAGATYFVRAYATNSVGTAYGAQTSFTTTAASTGSVSDIDGNVYPTVQIGSQVWMAANLRTTRYRTGATITNVMNATTWSGLTTGAWAHYDNNSANETVYGKLYNWHAVADSRNICPTGWHVPSDAEWTVLSTFLGTDVGFKMKSSTGWDNNGNGSNESGFNGLPGGARYEGGAFDGVGWIGGFWGSSEYSSGDARFRFLDRGGRGLGRDNFVKRGGFSVRCVRD